MLRDAVRIIDSQPGRPACGNGGGSSWTTLTEAASLTMLVATAPGGGHVRDHGTLHAARCPLADDHGVDRPGERFLGAVSGGLIALGLVDTAAKAGVAFYVFGIILLPRNPRCSRTRLRWYSAVRPDHS